MKTWSCIISVNSRLRIMGGTYLGGIFDASFSAFFVLYGYIYGGGHLGYLGADLNSPPPDDSWN